MDYIACQAPPSMGFSRQEYWSGSSFPSPGDLPDPGIKSGLLHCSQILSNWATKEATYHTCRCCCCITSIVSDSVRPHRWQPTRFHGPWDSPGKNTGVSCHFLLQSMKVKSESEVAQSCLTLSDTLDCSPPGSSVHGIFQPYLHLLITARMPLMLWIPAEVIAKSLRIPVLYTSLVYMHNPTIVHEIHQLTQEVVSAEAFQFIFLYIKEILKGYSSNSLQDKELFQGDMKFPSKERRVWFFLLTQVLPN